MYDLELRRCLQNVKVKDVIGELELLNQEANFSLDGLDEFFIHSTGAFNEEARVTLDVSDLEEEYREDYEIKNKEFPEDINEKTLIPIESSYKIPRFRLIELLLLMIDTYYGKDTNPKLIARDLKSYGFTDKELEELQIGV